MNKNSNIKNDNKGTEKAVPLNVEKTVENLNKDQESNSNIKIVKTDIGNKDGQTKCPKCGATDITLNINNGKLRCNFCRHEFDPQKIEGMENDISKLSGIVMGSGASNIQADVSEVMTFKCSSCGAEVVVDTKSSMTARCHWCRNTLSVNEQIPNGAVPDVLLPFSVKKEEAQQLIEQFVGKRKFYAHPKFKQEFTTENIMGVYFPYMIIDLNTHSNLSGQGEHLVRKYTVKNGDSYDTYYDADLYDVKRDFDLTISGLTVESSLDKLDTKNKTKTTNIINSIMPFDIENSIKYSANYLSGYTSEKRDTNIDDLKPMVELQAGDIARHAANDTIKYYNRGVRWDNEKLDIKGEQWKAAYLPVWLYSYQQKKGDESLLHYVAVNARTKETMGSVPIHMPRLLIISGIIEFISAFLMLLVDWDYKFLFLLMGFIYFSIIYGKYRNAGARHTYEKETKRDMTNLKEEDNFVRHEKGLSNSTMRGANNNSIKGSIVNKSLFDKAKERIKK